MYLCSYFLLTMDRKKLKRYARGLLDNFLKGIFVMTPLAITIGAVFWVFNKVDSILPDIVQFFLDIIFVKKVTAPHIFGLGFILFILMIAGIGYLSSFILFNRILILLDRQLLKAPGVKMLYSMVKDFVKTFQKNNKQFDKPVLFTLDETEKIWRMGFITREDMAVFGLSEVYVTVYSPMSFSVAGEVFIVHTSKIRVLQRIPPAAAMKFLVSGGLSMSYGEEAANDEDKNRSNQ